jgi:uncharacterized protein YbaP (TraB family)
MKHFYLSILVLFLLGGSRAQLLWEISGNGLQTKSYLYGTIHVMPKEKFLISPKIQNAFQNTTVLALEVKLKMSLIKQIKIAKKSFLPKGKTLKNYLSENDFLRLKTYCIDSIKLTESKFNKYIHLKPFFFSSLITQEQMGEISSYEIELDKMAKSQRKRRMGLESIEYQLEIINKMSIEDQVKMMMDEIDVNPSTQFNGLLNLYLNEDLNGLYEAVTAESNEIPDFNQNFLVKRNTNWIPIIEKQISKKATFIAVGAAHLPGENGVIQLLKSKGYQVVPVN